MLIFLIGFMGSGKSYVGKLLAGKLNCPFIDLDEYIEQQENKTIPQLFEIVGESGFRQLEKKHLKSLNQQKAVIATGGGTPCFFDNLSYMQNLGLVIFLNVPSHVLVKRLQAESAQRPLIAELGPKALEKFIEDKLVERLAYYNQATIIYDYLETEDTTNQLYYLINNPGDQSDSITNSHKSS